LLRHRHQAPKFKQKTPTGHQHVVGLVALRHKEGQRGARVASTKKNRVAPLRLKIKNSLD
jgi:hypothetical protein